MLRAICLVALLAAAPLPLHAQGPKEDFDAWNKAARRPAPTAEKTKAFMKRLAQYVHDHHLRRDKSSQQRGMVYEYFDVARKGQHDQFVQGEALDTMHDGAWLAAALVNASRATGDPFYKDFLTRWQLPFYCKMLNHSDTLFSAKQNDARPGAHTFGKEHALQTGEKGFVPYWWDDGGSVSLERRRDKNPLGAFACTDHLAGRPNPKFLLSGYSHGSSNHLAQDLGVMLQQAWLLLRDSKDPADRKLAAEVAEAAKNLHACRMRHHGYIPVCVAPTALASGNAELMRRVPDESKSWTPSNHYTRALYDYKPGQRYALPGFADDQQYRYYAGLAKHGGKLPPALAFRVVYDAFTEPMLFRYYSDDATVPPGVNRFDLHPYYAKDGRLEDYRSDRKGPSKRPRPVGSRMGPQNMIAAGWALQLLDAHPGLWEERYKREFAKDARVVLHDPIPGKEGAKPKWTPIRLGDVELELSARREGLLVKVFKSPPDAEIKLFARPDGQGSHAVIRRKGEAVTVNNEQGQELFFRRFDAEPKGAFLVMLPYTVHQGQRGAWANGIEHGRYSVRAGDRTANFYVASPEGQVKDWLAYDLGQGLRVWEEIFNTFGYIPTGIDAGSGWDRFSDSGGYAHLISAASQWLLHLQNKKDWEVHEVPAVK